MIQRAQKPFTGYHMTAILVGFFGIIIAVNFMMAKVAIGTFSGTVVKNSYVASQNYNQWLAEADKEAALGWTISATRLGDDRVEAKLADKGVPTNDFTVKAIAEHPIRRATSLPLIFVRSGDGTYVSSTKLPKGRWKLRLETSRSGQVMHSLADIT